MAGSFGVKTDPKHNKLAKNAFNSEVFKDSPEYFSQKNQKNTAPTTKFSLGGILGLNQTVELNKKTGETNKQNEKVLFGISHLEKENQILLDNHQRELKRAIEDLRLEIKKLANATDNLEKNVEAVIINPTTDASEYQLNFLQRIQKVIVLFRKSISEAGNWLESFNNKKKKKNYFWNTAKNKKKGGTEYLFSNEHSAARSVN